MKKIITGNIAPGQNLPGTKGVLDHLQLAYQEAIQALARLLTGNSMVNDGNIYILAGCVLATGGTTSVSNGYLYYDGEIYFCAGGSWTPLVDTIVATISTAYADATPLKYSNGNSFPTLAIRTIIINDAVSGSGIADFGNWIKPGKNINNLNTKIVNIGDWDMDGTVEVIVAHGCSNLKIRGVEVIIFTDNGVTISFGSLANGNTFSLNSCGATESTPQGGIVGMSATEIVLSRLTGGLFDSASFNQTSYNRGYLKITYAN